MEKQYVLGLDNGGTVTKAALFDLEGHEICTAARNTPVVSLGPDTWSGIWTNWWQANCGCIRQVLRHSGIAAESIIGVAVCGHGKGLYLWGKDSRPAYPGIGSTDNRAWRVTEQWYRDGTFERVYPQICQRLLPASRRRCCGG